MFWFWKKESVPQQFLLQNPAEDPGTAPNNPGTLVKCQFALANGVKSIFEQIDLVALLARTLKKAGHSVRAVRSCVVLDSKLILMPRMVFTNPTDTGAQTCSTIEVLGAPAIPTGIFEYQHSTGDTAETSFCTGFEQWERTDLPVFLDALRVQAKTCMALEMTLPAVDGSPEIPRRALLGPVMQFQAKQPDAQEEHPFCNCCLLTRSMPAFKRFVFASEFFGLRLFIARDQNGNTSADCRVNGEDYDEGKLALADYAKTWPDAGYEFRKQYIVLQNKSK